MDDIKNLFTPDIEAERLDSITQKVIGGAIVVHRALGPGFWNRLMKNASALS